jgi:hypothetical protein
VARVIHVRNRLRPDDLLATSLQGKLVYRGLRA